MLNQERLKETLDTANFECWGCERTATPVRVFAVHLHATGCSLREIQEILRLFGVERSHQAIWYRVHKISHSSLDPLEVKPKRVAVDETAVKINGKLCWLYTAIYLTQSLFWRRIVRTIWYWSGGCIHSSPYRETPSLRLSPETVGFWCAHNTNSSCGCRISRQWIRLSDCTQLIMITRSPKQYWQKPY